MHGIRLAAIGAAQDPLMLPLCQHQFHWLVAFRADGNGRLSWDILELDSLYVPESNQIKLGHCQNQTRPLGIGAGQHHKENGNRSERRTRREQSPRIFPERCCLVLPETADNCRVGKVSKMQKAPILRAFRGGRTRDRTLDLSRVKGTLPLTQYRGSKMKQIEGEPIMRKRDRLAD